ncbi:MAG: hypothetical protein K5989_08865 [Lachnospiraceae bacterium]|nr:hypothetical protein [Lachnospiraceae bacterium]
MYCIFCGKQINDKSRFCKYCGACVIETEEKPPQEMPSTNISPENTGSAPYSKPDPIVPARTPEPPIQMDNGHRESQKSKPERPGQIPSSKSSSNDRKGGFPIIPVAIISTLVILAIIGVVVFLFLFKGSSHKEEASNEKTATSESIAQSQLSSGEKENAKASLQAEDTSEAAPEMPAEASEPSSDAPAEPTEEADEEVSDPETDALIEKFNQYRNEGYEVLQAVPFESLPIRSSPGDGDDILTELGYGAYLLWDGRKETVNKIDYYFVKDMESGQEGYVNSHYTPRLWYLYSSQDSFDIVDVSKADYSYEEMCADIEELCNEYSDILSSSILGQSLCGRNIPLIILGDPKASHKFMIQAGIHGREYMTSQFVMKMTEYYAHFYQKGDYRGNSYEELMQDKAFYIIPMINPDGVSISQKGESAVTGEYLECLRNAYENDKNDIVFIKDINDELAWYDNFKHKISPKLFQNTDFIPYNDYLKMWKANAAAVDLNRNFDTGWQTSWGKGSLALGSYRGPAPESEPETQIIRDAAVMEDFDCYISYHARGQLIYYHSEGASGKVAEKSKYLADYFYDINRYKPSDPDPNAPPDEDPEYGSFGDYAHLNLDKPGITIEIGKYTCPLRISEFKAIWDRNRETWAALCTLF